VASTTFPVSTTKSAADAAGGEKKLVIASQSGAKNGVRERTAGDVGAEPMPV
jgi:hypothetical protein